MPVEDVPMISTDDDILTEAQAWKEAGRAVAIATVIETWGSAPRPVGSHLVVDADGAMLGSVSGGCVEGEVVTEAADVIESGTPRVLDFGVADDTAWKAGLSCGGKIRIYIDRLDDARLPDLARLNAERAARRPAALVTDLSRGTQRVVAGAALVSDPLAHEIAERLRQRKGAIAEIDGRQHFIAVEVPAVRLIAVGAVHISQALAAMATLTDLDVTIVDPRTAFATPERFPGVTLLAEWPDDILPKLKLDRYTAVALLTHDPKIDDQALVASLRAGCFYVGALGSRKTHARRLDRMRTEGFGDDDLARIHAPIGLDIGAVSPAEIAVSILGEIIAAQHRKPLRAEKDRAA